MDFFCKKKNQIIWKKWKTVVVLKKVQMNWENEVATNESEKLSNEWEKTEK